MTSNNNYNNSNDPNGWVTNPPSTFIQIQNVMNRPTLNEQYGLIVQYDNTKERYIIILCQHQQDAPVALKVQNCRKISPYSYDTILAYYYMIRYHPNTNKIIQQTIQQITNKILIPYHISKMEYIAIFLAFVFLFLLYMIGFTKLLIVMTLLFMIVSLIGYDWIQNKPITTTLLKQRYSEMIQSQIPYVGTTIVRRPIYLQSFTLVLFLFITYTLFGTPTNSYFMNQFYPNNKTKYSIKPRNNQQRQLSESWYSSPSSSSSSSSSSSKNNLQTTREYYYQLGYHDAKNSYEYGTSLLLKKNESVVDPDVIIHDDGSTTTASSSSILTVDDDDDDNNNNNNNNMKTTTPKDDPPYYTTSDNDALLYNDNNDDDHLYDTSRMNNKRNKSSSIFSFSTLMSLFTLYRIFTPIIQMSINHTTRTLDIPLLIRNLHQQMDMFKIAATVFALYRIVITFL